MYGLIFFCVCLDIVKECRNLVKKISVFFSRLCHHFCNSKIIGVAIYSVLYNLFCSIVCNIFCYIISGDFVFNNITLCFFNRIISSNFIFDGF